LDAPERASAQSWATHITSLSDENTWACRYFFSAGLSELALLFSEEEEELLLFELSLLLSAEDAEADPLPLDEFPLELDEDFFA
jgi:hypothetical protein